MENVKEVAKDSAPCRKKRVKRLKVIIVTFILMLLILPCICCIFLLFKVNQIEKQLEILSKMHREDIQIYQEEKDALSGVNIVYAAEKDKTEDESEDKTAPIEESDNSNVVTDTKNTESVVPIDSNINNSINQKKVYLTFDDGPSDYTDDILDVLNKYNIKASFFVIGKTDDKSKELYKRIVNEGHTLGMHSYSHRYNNIYKSKEDFIEDFTKLSDLLYDTTGERSKFYRFPGGSSNTVSKVPMTQFISLLNKENMIYYDWNVDSGDAMGRNITPKQLVSNVMKQVVKHNNSVVLLHDTDAKETTVKALSKLIQQLKKEHYLIVPIGENDTPIQHIKSEDVVQ